MYLVRIWLQKLHAAGFRQERTNGGHARFRWRTIPIDVPIHQKELSRTVVASLKRALKAALIGERP